LQTDADDVSEEAERERRMADLDVEGSLKWTAGEVESVVEVWRFQCDFFVHEAYLDSSAFIMLLFALCVSAHFFACSLGGLSSLHLCLSYNIFV
jgi:hypothetical protein